MSCACQHRKLSGEIDRIRRLAKALAVMENADTAIYTEGGGYNFALAELCRGRQIIEYISPY